MTLEQQPPRAVIRDEDLEPAVDSLLALGRRRGEQLRQLRSELDILRDEFAHMGVLDLLEYARQLMSSGPPIREDLVELRWRAFGQLADRIAETSDDASRTREHAEAIEQLRGYLFSFELARRRHAEPQLHIGRLLREQLRSGLRESVGRLQDEQLVRGALDLYWKDFGQDESIDAAVRRSILDELNELQRQLQEQTVLSDESRGRLRSFLFTALYER